MIVSDNNINPMLWQACRSHPAEEIACRPRLTGSRVGADQMPTGSRHIPLWRPHEPPRRQCQHANARMAPAPPPSPSGSFGSPSRHAIDGLLAMFGEVFEAFDGLEPEVPEHGEQCILRRAASACGALRAFVRA
jgi:hypothetical protein